MKEYSKGIYVKFKPEEVEILHDRIKEAGVHMAHPNGRVCGAKRPKCEAERSHHL